MKARSDVENRQGEQLAATVGVPMTPFSSRHRLSSRFWFFGDQNVLAVIAKPGPSKSVDRGLAYGLAHHQDRDLVLVLPEGTEAPTLARVPWLDVPVFVWSYDPEDVSAPPRQLVVPCRVEVLASFRDELETRQHDLGDRAGWVERLRAWADATPDLKPAHRKTYLSWHCSGRAVLKIRRHRGGVAVKVGVQYSEKPIEFDEILGGAISVAQFDRAVTAARRAITDRIEGVDDDHVEHRFQSVLAAHPHALGLSEMVREFPSFRPAGRSYVDFLGLDRSGRIHIVETKVGEDDMLVLQALDYYVWVSAHRHELAEHFGLAREPEVLVDLVTARKGPKRPFVGRYSGAQLEALDRSIDWRFHTVDEWEHGEPAVTHWPKRDFPKEKRVADPRFALRAEAHLCGFAPGEVIGGVLHAERTAGIAPEAVVAFRKLEEEGLLHRRVDHVRSSQAFAINLFGPMSAVETARVFEMIGVDVATAEPPVLEWSDPEDRLGELQPARPHQTQVDVVCRGVDARGSRHLLFIEVKLTETDFGHCSAYASDRNEDRDICRQPGAWGNDPERCFLLRNHGGPHRRKYDRHLPTVTDDSAGVGCAFRLSANQPMRNVVLARSLAEAGEADVAHMALCAPSRHGAIWRRWANVKQVLGGAGVHLHDLRAAEVARLHGEPLCGWLEERYSVPELSRAM